MKITFSFTDTPNISSLKRNNIFNSHFKLPDEAGHLSDCKDRVLAIATLVGKLTWARLHVTCYEVGLKEYPIKTIKTENRDMIPNTDKGKRLGNLRPPVEVGGGTNHIRMVLQPIAAFSLNRLEIIERSKTAIEEWCVG